MGPAVGHSRVAHGQQGGARTSATFRTESSSELNRTLCGRARASLSNDALHRTARALASEMPHGAAKSVPSGSNHQSVDLHLYKRLNNLSPGSFTPVLYNDASTGLTLRAMRWGLVPSFTKKEARPDPFRLFNTRSETVSEKPSFSRLIASKRCVVLLNGFYE